MCDKDYYTPKNNGTHYFTPQRDTSDSEESTHSNGDYVPSSTPTNHSGSGDLTLVAEFDDFIRLLKQQRNDEVEDAFIDVMEQMELMRMQWEMATKECRRLQVALDVKNQDIGDMETKLHHARKMIDHEKKRSRRIEEERDILEAQISRVKEYLFLDGRTKLPEDTREKLSFLNNVQNWDPNIPPTGLSAIQEVNTTGSLLSDFSYSKSEDDLDLSSLQCGKQWKKHRPSAGHMNEPAQKKRRSSTHKVVEIANSDSVRATTTLTVPKHGPITATSVIESVPNSKMEIDGKAMEAEEFPIQASAPAQQDLIYEIWQSSPNQNNKGSGLRQHSLQTKTVVLPDTCGPCDKRIKFGKTALKCKDCRATCHPECKDNLTLPCIPYVNTPTQRNILGLISDYTPTTPPMVPAIIVHCINEIELRGFNEIGIYRIPGSERDVKQLKEKFLRGKGAPCLKQMDVHVICGTVKDFLRSLHEPLITYNLWPNFVRCIESWDNNVSPSCLYDIISELPQPNRDTLAYMILHLKRVSDSKECKMPISNLSKIFGPTIVGYSSSDPSRESLLTETRQQNLVMEALMNLPTDYWASFINVEEQCQPRLQQTPSTDSLLRPTATKPFFTPRSIRNTKRKQKFFPTPPSYKY